jgi:hypothetical protein
VLLSLPLLLVAAQAAEAPPLPEGNAYVRALVSRQRSREEALNKYTYDVDEIEEELDGKGLVQKTETRRYEVFHVKGRPIRKQVALNGHPLTGAAAQKEERRVKEKVDDVLDDRATTSRRWGGKTWTAGRPWCFRSRRCRASATSRPISCSGG